MIAAAFAVATALSATDGRLGDEWKGIRPRFETGDYTVFSRSDGAELHIAVRSARPGPLLLVVSSERTWRVLLAGHSRGEAAYLVSGPEALLRQAFRFQLNDQRLEEKFGQSPSAQTWSASAPTEGEPGVMEIMIPELTLSARWSLIFRGNDGSIIQCPETLVDDETATAWLRGEAPTRITVGDAPTER